MHAFEDLMTALKESNRPYDFDKITEAYQYASKAHEGQMRQSGDPYITHPIAVAQHSGGAGNGHRDHLWRRCCTMWWRTPPPRWTRLKSSFGADVALMVDGVTKLGQDALLHQGAARRRKMCARCCWRWPRTSGSSSSSWPTGCTTCAPCEYMPKEYKRRDKALETMEVYAPLADRLGIRSIKEELEDICAALPGPGCL